MDARTRSKRKPRSRSWQSRPQRWRLVDGKAVGIERWLASYRAQTCACRRLLACLHHATDEARARALRVVKVGELAWCKCGQWWGPARKEPLYMLATHALFSPASTCELRQFAAVAIPGVEQRARIDWDRELLRTTVELLELRRARLLRLCQRPRDSTAALREMRSRAESTGAGVAS